MSIINSKLFKEIRDELFEDFHLNVDRIDQIDRWCESWIDYPTDKLVGLLKQIPKDQQGEWYKLIDQEIEIISEDYREELYEVED